MKYKVCETCGGVFNVHLQGVMCPKLDGKLIIVEITKEQLEARLACMNDFTFRE